MALPNITVAEYLAWVRGALGESVYQQLLQSSPQALNFDRVITLEEQYLYGSKRLGVRRPQLELGRAAHNPNGYEEPVEPTPPAERFGNACLCTEPIPGGEEPYYPGVAFAARFYTHTLGMKEYEITNHLGNVLATVLDRKTGIKASPTATTYAYFKADVTTAQDYYPFGSLMPGRTYVAPANAAYRFGFNGKEVDKEIYGFGNFQDYGMRAYNVMIGRFLSVDPLANKYPELSTFQFAGNTPIQAIDLDGLEPAYVNSAGYHVSGSDHLYNGNPDAVPVLLVPKEKSLGRQAFPTNERNVSLGISTSANYRGASQEVSKYKTKSPTNAPSNVQELGAFDNT